MNCAKKIFLPGIIIIIFCVITTAMADASGFCFQWKPFTVDDDLYLDKPGRKIFIRDDRSAGPYFPVSENTPEASYSHEDNEKSLEQKSEKKSLLDNIKIDISSAKGIKEDKQTIYTDSDDEKISKFIDAMTSLIYDDSKIKSLENIGRIIEPQINFYFEF